MVDRLAVRDGEDPAAEIRGVPQAGVGAKRSQPGLLIAVVGVVEADRHGTVVGLFLVAGEAVLGLVVYLLLLSVLAPATTRELAAGSRRLSARLRGSEA